MADKAGSPMSTDKIATGTKLEARFVQPSTQARQAGQHAANQPGPARFLREFPTLIQRGKQSF